MATAAHRTRVRQTREESRARIVDAAARLLRERSYAELTVDEVMREAGQGRTLFVANLQYTGVIFATLIGWFWFGDTFEWIEAAGIALIVLSGVAASTSSVTPSPSKHPTPRSSP